MSRSQRAVDDQVYEAAMINLGVLGASGLAMALAERLEAGEKHALCQKHPGDSSHAENENGYHATSTLVWAGSSPVSPINAFRF